jgi:hypothetical protein
MYDPMSTGVWYGELRTDSGSTVVIHDPKIPPSSNGRVYLFNAERGALIEYVEAIVKSKLFDLDAEQTKAARKKYAKAWKAAQNKFNSRFGLSSNVVEIKSAKPKPVVEEEDDFDDDDMEYNSLFAE